MKTFMRFREITVYNTIVAKITHLVAYVRTDEVNTSKKEQMGKDWVKKGDPFKV
jgi:hypothetical protein